MQLISHPESGAWGPAQLYPVEAVTEAGTVKVLGGIETDAINCTMILHPNLHAINCTLLTKQMMAQLEKSAYFNRLLLAGYNRIKKLERASVETVYNPWQTIITASLAGKETESYVLCTDCMPKASIRAPGDRATCAVILTQPRPHILRITPNHSAGSHRIAMPYVDHVIDGYTNGSASQ
jgi:hypothetical protein